MRGPLAMALSTVLVASCHEGGDGPGATGDVPGADASTTDAAPVHDGASVIVDAAIDAGPAVCAVARIDGDWTGYAEERDIGAGGYTADGAHVTWTFASTSGCIDHYTPSGTQRT